MALRINNNVSALNAHRHLVSNTKAQSKNLEKLSSGLRINRAADSPAGLVISERLRSEISGLKQSIDNTEAGITLMQTAEGALEEVSRSLINIRQLAVASANSATNDDFMTHANQEELENSLLQIDRIARMASYGKKAILDGSQGANGVTAGDHLDFVSATENTKASPPGGYKVEIKQVATRATIQGSLALTNAIIDEGEQLTFMVDGRTLDFRTEAGDTIETSINKLEKAVQGAGLNIEIVREPGSATLPNQPQFLKFRHKEFGSMHSFQVTSNTAGILSMVGDVPDTIKNGLDVGGNIGGEFALGEGQTLTGSEPTKISGMKIRYTAEKVPEGGFAGTVTLAQNSGAYQIGPFPGQSTSFSLKDVGADQLGKGVKNDSGFRSLHDINIDGRDKALDTMKIVDEAIREVTMFRGEMGAFHKNNLESNLNYLRNAHENITNAESVIRDADMAEEMSKFTKNQIMVQSNVAMLAQANQKPQALLTLLQGA